MSDQRIKCGQVANVLLAGGLWQNCALEEGHEGECQPEGNCVRHGHYIGLRCPHWPTCIKSL